MNANFNDDPRGQPSPPLKKVHHTNREDYDQSLIDGAVYFTVTEFKGRGKYEHHGGKIETLKDAREVRRVMKKANPKVRLMIYAVNKEHGRDISVHVE